MMYICKNAGNFCTFFFNIYIYMMYICKNAGNFCTLFFNSYLFFKYLNKNKLYLSKFILLKIKNI